MAPERSGSGAISIQFGLFQNVFDDGFFRNAPQSAVAVGFELAGL